MASSADPVFAAYSGYYDLLYADKDYASEVDYVERLLKTYAPSARSLLDVGCGTGRHTIHLARRGYTLTGVDLSATMLDEAARRRDSESHDTCARLSFTRGDIRELDLGERFDAVLSLFHVISYQTTNRELRRAFEACRRHVKPEGILVFDCWYGPGVLTDRPSLRVKRLENDVLRVTRIAEPVLHPNDSVVDVNYELLVEQKATSTVTTIREKHRMRYLFRPEVEDLLEQAGFELVGFEEWMSGRRPDEKSWCVCFVARPTGSP